MIVITSSYAIPVYMREKVVNGVELGISFLAYGMFLVCIFSQSEDIPVFLLCDNISCS